MLRRGTGGDHLYWLAPSLRPTAMWMALSSSLRPHPDNGIWNFIFVGIFVYGRKWKMLFGRPLIYITKRSWSWSWDAKSWSLIDIFVLNIRLGLGLGLEKKPCLHHWRELPLNICCSTSVFSLLSNDRPICYFCSFRACVLPPVSFIWFVIFETSTARHCYCYCWWYRA